MFRGTFASESSASLTPDCFSECRTDLQRSFVLIEDLLKKNLAPVPSSSAVGTEMGSSSSSGRSRFVQLPKWSTASVTSTPGLLGSLSSSSASMPFAGSAVVATSSRQLGMKESDQALQLVNGDRTEASTQGAAALALLRERAASRAAGGATHAQGGGGEPSLSIPSQRQQSQWNNSSGGARLMNSAALGTTTTTTASETHSSHNSRQQQPAPPTSTTTNTASAEHYYSDTQPLSSSTATTTSRSTQHCLPVDAELSAHRQSSVKSLLEIADRELLGVGLGRIFPVLQAQRTATLQSGIPSDPKKVVKTFTEVLKTCKSLRSLTAVPHQKGAPSLPAPSLPLEGVQLLLSVLRYALSLTMAQLHEALHAVSGEAAEVSSSTSSDGDANRSLLLLLRRHLPIRGWLHFIDRNILLAEDMKVLLLDGAGSDGADDGSVLRSVGGGARTAGGVVLEDVAHLLCLLPDHPSNSPHSLGESTRAPLGATKSGATFDLLGGFEGILESLILYAAKGEVSLCQQILREECVGKWIRAPFASRLHHLFLSDSTPTRPIGEDVGSAPVRSDQDEEKKDDHIMPDHTSVGSLCASRRAVLQGVGRLRWLHDTIQQCASPQGLGIHPSAAVQKWLYPRTLADDDDNNEKVDPSKKKPLHSLPPLVVPLTIHEKSALTLCLRREVWQPVLAQLEKSALGGGSSSSKRAGHHLHHHRGFAIYVYQNIVRALFPEYDSGMLQLQQNEEEDERVTTRARLLSSLDSTSRTVLFRLLRLVGDLAEGELATSAAATTSSSSSVRGDKDGANVGKGERESAMERAQRQRQAEHNKQRYQALLKQSNGVITMQLVGKVAEDAGWLVEMTPLKSPQGHFVYKAYRAATEPEQDDDEGSSDDGADEDRTRRSGLDKKKKATNKRNNSNNSASGGGGLLYVYMEKGLLYARAPRETQFALVHSLEGLFGSS